ncbi:hypothetical protein [Burkholderia diffusa]|uniref:hypothetical protein n=1 Tax=Burkholderia diffusa TaxID=488732 RepID=UPI00075A4B8E|nr:hypothetical protein [Burkholderia diffusa]KVN02955.1 tRNA-ribosyltransferase [Burkholderia diffusa]
MNEIESYIPHFIVHGRSRIAQCECASCRAQTPFVTNAWSNQVRHSAQIQCDSVSREALFERDAFKLHTQPSFPGDGEPLSAWQNNVNQSCINFLIVEDLSIEERLHATGVLLSRLSRDDLNESDASTPQSIGDELLTLAASGVIRQRFSQMPSIDRYKRDYLRRLAKVHLRVTPDPIASLAFNLKLTELQVMSDGFLEDVLREIESSRQVEAFFGKHGHVWTNYFLHRCFHDVFPGAARNAYDVMFLDLCLDLFCLRSLCAFLADSDVELTEESVSALFSAWHRGGKECLGRDDHVDPLLVGYSLITRKDDRYGGCHER